MTYAPRLAFLNASAISPSSQLSFPSSAQPVFARNFGGESSEAELTANMAVNASAQAGPSATLIGSPAIAADYFTTVGQGGAGLLLPFMPTGAFSAILCAQSPGWTTTNFAQLLGNGSSGGAGIAWNVGVSGVAGSQVFSYDNESTFVALQNGTIPPAAWKLYGLVCVPGTSQTLYDFTNGTSQTSPSTTALATQVAELALGSFYQAGTSDAAVNIAEFAIWNYALGGAPGTAGSEIALVLTEMRNRIMNKNGITGI